MDFDSTLKTKMNGVGMKLMACFNTMLTDSLLLNLSRLAITTWINSSPWCLVSPGHSHSRWAISQKLLHLTINSGTGSRGLHLTGGIGVTFTIMKTPWCGFRRTGFTHQKIMGADLKLRCLLVTGLSLSWLNKELVRKYQKQSTACLKKILVKEPPSLLPL